MQEEIAGLKDMTKCVAYKACGKTPDWSNEVTVAPTTTTTPPTTQPTNQPPVTNSPETDGPPVTNKPPVTNGPGTEVPPVTNDAEIPEPDSRYDQNIFALHVKNFRLVCQISTIWTIHLNVALPTKE